MSSPSQTTPSHGRIKIFGGSPADPESVGGPDSIGQAKKPPSEPSLSTTAAEPPHSPNLLRMVHEKNLQQHATDLPTNRPTSGALLRQYSCMQGVPEIEGMQETEAPLTEIEVKTVVELFGIKVTRPVKPPPRTVRVQTKKKEADKRMALRIHLQDNSYRMVSTFKKSTGYDLLLQCAEEMGCEAPEYFNLAQTTDEGVDRWLDLNMALDALGLEEGDSVHFKIKYFKQPAYKLDEVSLQLFFVQTKRSILSGNFIVPERIALLLAAFQLQIFYGTYDPEASWLPGLANNLGEFLPADHLATAPPEQWSARIIHYYQYLYDLTANEATYGYLAVARRVPACGACLFPVLQGKLHVTIGIVEDGIIFFKDDKKSMFEFYSFDDLLAWANIEGGVALRLQKKISPRSSPPSATASTEAIDAKSTNQSTSPPESPSNEYFQMRVTYDCSTNQSLTIIDLLEGYNFLLSRMSQERQQMLISVGLRPVAGPSAYLAPARRVQDEPFGSKLDHFLNAYRHACNLDHVVSFAPFLQLVDQLDFPGKLDTINLDHSSFDQQSSIALMHAIEQSQRYKSSVDDQEIAHNFELTEVSVAKNRVAPSFPSIAIYAPTLSSLNISSNGFTKEDQGQLAASFKQVTNLTELYLADNELNDKFLQSLVSQLTNCHHLRILDLSANSIKGTTAFYDLGKLIKSCKRFETLILHHNKLSDSAIESLISSIESASIKDSVPSKSSTSSTHPVSITPSRNFNFDFRYSGLSSKAIAALAGYAKREKSIRALKLAGNTFSSSSVLSDALKEDVGMLVLDVGDAGFGKKGWSELFAGLAKQLDSSRFEATGGLDKTGWSALRMHMREVTTRISHFEFENCAISSQALSSLGDILNHNACFISKLVLKGAQFGKKDFTTFAEIVSQAPTLMHLDLSNAKLENIAAPHIASILRTNTALASLRLDYNLLGDVAVAEIADALRINTSLEFVYLRHNALTVESIPYWSDCVSSNCVLQIIDLRGNGLVLDQPTKALLVSVPCMAEILL